MALIAVLTDAGAQLRADNIANSTTSDVSLLAAGEGNVAGAALARALAALVSPFATPRENADPPGNALPNDPVIQFQYLDPASVDYDITEFGLFAGAVMTHYICDDAGATLYSKTATLQLDVRFYIAFASGDFSTFTFQAPMDTPIATETAPGIVRLATEAQDEATFANAVDTRVTSPLGRWRWWNALTIAASKIPNLSASKITSGMLGFGRLPAATTTEAERGLVTDDDSVMSPYKTRLAIEALSPEPTLVGSANVSLNGGIWTDTGLDVPTSPSTWGGIVVKFPNFPTSHLTRFRWSDLTVGTSPVAGANHGVTDNQVGFVVNIGLGPAALGVAIAADANNNLLFASNDDLYDPMPLWLYDGF